MICWCGRDAVEGGRCGLHARRAARDPRTAEQKRHDEETAFMATRPGSDKPTLMLARFAPGETLERLLDSDENSLGGKPLREVARDELDRRAAARADG